MSDSDGGPLANEPTEAEQAAGPSTSSGHESAVSGLPGPGGNSPGPEAAGKPGPEGGAEAEGWEVIP
jgi:hypothetical protein